MAAAAAWALRIVRVLPHVLLAARLLARQRADIDVVGPLYAPGLADTATVVAGHRDPPG